MPTADTAREVHHHHHPARDVWLGVAERTQLTMEMGALRDEIAQLRADLFPPPSALIIGPEVLKIFRQLPKV